MAYPAQTDIDRCAELVHVSRDGYRVLAEIARQYRDPRVKARLMNNVAKVEAAIADLEAGRRNMVAAMRLRTGRTPRSETLRAV